MSVVIFILVLLALVCFGAAAAKAPVKVDLTASGLFLLTLAYLLGGGLPT